MSSKDKVLYLIQDSIGGTIHQNRPSGKPISVLNIPPKRARMVLSRICKYLVAKRRYAEVVLEFLGQASPPFDENKKNAYLEYLKIQRRIPETRIPNYPARKWLAGYFDGDGCLACDLHPNGRSYLSARITTHYRDKVAIDLIHRLFGGRLYETKRPHGVYPMLVINLVPSKAKQFLNYFIKYSVVKKAQGYFILGCAQGGNYRDGKIIRDTLSSLKSQEQRLNDLDVDVSILLQGVSFNISPNRPVTYAIVHRKR